MAQKSNTHRTVQLGHMVPPTSMPHNVLPLLSLSLLVRDDNRNRNNLTILLHTYGHLFDSARKLRIRIPLRVFLGRVCIPYYLPSLSVCHLRSNVRFPLCVHCAVVWPGRVAVMRVPVERSKVVIRRGEKLADRGDLDIHPGREYMRLEQSYQ